MMSVWIAITAATTENGCLRIVLSCQHRMLALHCVGIRSTRGNLKMIAIPDHLIGDDARPVTAKAGSMIFMDEFTMHSSLTNTGNEMWWSFDLRYAPVGQLNGPEWFPGFMARSRSLPESELAEWRLRAESWYETWERLAVTGMREFTSWKERDPLCI